MSSEKHLYPQVVVPLTDQDGNAMMIIVRARTLAKQAGLPIQVLNDFSFDATQGDYDNLLRTVMKYFTTT